MPGRAIALRWPILGLSAFVCAGFCILLFAYIGAVAASGAEALAISLASGGAGYWLLRSWRLALLALAVPLVTAIFAFGILTPVATMYPALCGVLIPHAVATVLMPVSGAGLAILYRFSADQCAGNDPDVAAQSATGQMGRAIIATLAIAGLWRLFLLLPANVLRLHEIVAATDVTALASIITALCGALIAFVLLPLAAGAVRFDEDYVSLANRLREMRARLLGFVALAAVPRWAMTILAIALVFPVLAAFSAPSLTSLWKEQGLLLPLVLLGVGAIAAAGMSDWRAFLASVLSAGFAASLGAAWCDASIALSISNSDLATLSWIGGAPLLAVTAAVGAACGCAVLVRLAAYRTFEYPLDVAFERALNEVAMPLICACVAFAVILLPAELSVLPLLALVSGLLLAPATLTVLEMVFPRYRSVEEIYGRG